MARRTTALVGAIVTAVAAATIAATSGTTTPATSLTERLIGPALDGAPLAAGLERAQTCDELTATLRTLATTVATNEQLRHGGFGGVEVMEDEMAMPEQAASDDSASGAEGTAAAGDAAASDGDSTNVQVVGVDEPDVVERLGGRVLTGFGGVLRVVEVQDGLPTEVGDLELAPWGDLGLLAVGEDRVAVLSRIEPDVRELPQFEDDAEDEALLDEPVPLVQRGVWSRVGVHLVDVSDPTDPTLLSTLELDGDLTAARSVDGVLRLAVRTGQPWVDVWRGGPVDDGDLAATLGTAYAATTTRDWLPEVTLTRPDGTSSTRQAVDCDRVGLPAGFAGLGMLTMAVVDATGDTLDLDDAETVVSSGETLYATADRLVVATTSWGPLVPFAELGLDPALVDPAVEELPADEEPPPADDDALFIEPDTDVPEGELLPIDPMPVEPWVQQEPTTQLHVFDVDRTLVDHVASGELEGRLVNQFALSIHDGVLRAAVTTGGWGGETQSSVVTHRVEGTELVEIGRVDGLGPDEDIQAVRYLGDTAYVVTFRRTDPLYVVDLSDPTAPRTLGELKIEGYSAYLHPLAPGQLLGVGQDADPETGITRGVQVSTFDVTDATDPRRLDVDVVRDSYSEAEWNHLAVTVADGLVALPIERWDEASGRSDVGTLLHRVDAAGGLDRLGVLSVGNQQWERYPRRSLLLDGGVLLTASDGGVTTWDVATLSTLGTTSTPMR